MPSFVCEGLPHNDTMTPSSAPYIPHQPRAECILYTSIYDLCLPVAACGMPWHHSMYPRHLTYMPDMHATTASATFHFSPGI